MSLYLHLCPRLVEELDGQWTIQFLKIENDIALEPAVITIPARTKSKERARYIALEFIATNHNTKLLWIPPYKVQFYIN